jgi:hypothetical protein
MNIISLLVAASTILNQWLMAAQKPPPQHVTEQKFLDLRRTGLGPNTGNTRSQMNAAIAADA